MERSIAYEIQFIGLKDGEHEFEFPIGNSFFDHFDDEEVLGANLQALVKLNKKTEMLEVLIRCVGSVDVLCDRCNKGLQVIADAEQRQIFKVSEREQFNNEEIVAISPNDHSIELSTFIYECITLHLPPRKVHKKKDCDPAALAALESNEPMNRSEVDPRWEALKTL